MIIAIDGPAGSGKSTVSKMVAEKLGLLYIDTGAMYRALTLNVMEKGAGFTDKEALIAIAKDTGIELKKADGGTLLVLLNGKDVSKEIRSPELTKNIKLIAGIAGVRREMLKMQRAVAKTGKGAVLEGRDIGTVVFPDADRKFYLDADFETRVRRRHKELLEAGQDIKLSDIREDVKLRDKSDIERQVAPLKKADDAVVIDTTGLSIGETVDKILSYIC